MSSQYHSETRWKNKHDSAGTSYTRGEHHDNGLRPLIRSTLPCPSMELRLWPRSRQPFGLIYLMCGNCVTHTFTTEQPKWISPTINRPLFPSMNNETNYHQMHKVPCTDNRSKPYWHSPLRDCKHGPKMATPTFTSKCEPQNDRLHYRPQISDNTSAQQLSPIKISNHLEKPCYTVQCGSSLYALVIER